MVPAQHHARPRRSRQRGVVLLLVLGVLALLSVLAVSFVFESRIELTAAENFERTVNAEDVATAGAQHAIRTLEQDKRRRTRGSIPAPPSPTATGGAPLPDTGDEEPYDALNDLWRANFIAPVRLEFTTDDPNEANLKVGTRLTVDDATPPAGVGTLVGVDTTTPSPGATLFVATENPAAWTAGDAVTSVGTPNTRFRQTINAVTSGTPNAVDLNADAAIWQNNGIDDDNDGTTDEADEGLDAVWFYYYDQQGDLAGRYAVRIDDESAKINLNVAHNLAGPNGTADNDPTNNVFSQNEGASAAELNVEAGTQSDTAEASKLVFYRYGRPKGDAGTAYAAGGADANRIYVPGQGLAESAAYSDRNVDDDDASRMYAANWYKARAAAASANGADDDADGCVDEFDIAGGETIIPLGDGVDNDGDGCIDELDEGVNDPAEFRPLRPFATQPQAGPSFEVDTLDNDGDGVTNERGEGNDQPLLSLEDLVSTDLVAMPVGPSNETWLDEAVEYALGTNDGTVANDLGPRRNVVTIESQDRNLDHLENPRVNPNVATADETAAAARSPFNRGFDTFREAEFRTLQAAINLYDYRDRNLIRDEVTDAAGNVFAGVEAVRINEIMVAPGTRLYDGEEADPTPGIPTGGVAPYWDVGLQSGTNPGGPLFDGAGSPRSSATPDYLHSDPGVPGAAQFTGAFNVYLPTGTIVGGPDPSFFDPGTGTDNDGDGLVNEDIPTDPDATPAVFYDEDPSVNGIDEDADAADGEDLVTDLDGDLRFAEDGSNANVASDDRTMRFVIRCRTNANAGFALGAANADRGFMVLVNGEAIWPSSAVVPGGAANPPPRLRWGIPDNMSPAQTFPDGQWFVQEGLCRVVPGVNTVEFLKPPTAAGVGPVDRVDIDWFYITAEPDAEWIELVNLAPYDVDVSGWQIQVNATLDDQFDTTVYAKPYTATATIPNNTVLDRATAAGPAYTVNGATRSSVFAVDALGAGNTVGVGTLAGNPLVDQEAADPNSPDTIAYDRIWPTQNSAAPQDPNRLDAVQLLIPTLFTPPFPTPGAVGDLADNDGDGQIDEADEETLDFIPFTELFPNEPIDDSANNSAPVDARNTPNIAEDDVTQGVDVATVSLLDANGNVMDRVTYDAVDAGWASDTGNPGVEENRGFGLLERRSPMYAGDRLLDNEEGIVGGGGGPPTRIANFVLRSYLAAQGFGYDAGGVTAPAEPLEVVLADGNYDDWTSRKRDPLPTPGVVNRTAPVTGNAAGVAQLEPLGLVKNAHLASVGEIADVPLDDGHPYDLDATQDNRETVVINEGVRAIVRIAAGGSLTAADYRDFSDTSLIIDDPSTDGLDNDFDGLIDGADADETLALVADGDFLRNRELPVGGGTEEHVEVTAGGGTTNLTVARGARGRPGTHAVGDVLEVLPGFPSRGEVATVTYSSDQARDPAVGDTITNVTQGGTTRLVLRVDATTNRMLLWDRDGDDPWEQGDTINNGTVGGLGEASVDDARVVAIHEPQAVDLTTLVDAYSTEALTLEPQVAAASSSGGWSNTAAAGDPAEYTIAITDTTNTLDLTWDRDDGVTDGTYNLYVYGEAGALLTVDVLDAGGAPIPALKRTNLPATVGDHLVAYGGITIPYDAALPDQLRLRFTNAGTPLGSGVTQNRVTRVVLAPPDRTLGRINLNTASDRVLLGLPNGGLDLADGNPGVGTDTFLAELIVQDRQQNGPYTTVADPFRPGGLIATQILTNGVDEDGDGTNDNPEEVDFVFQPLSNLTTVRSDVYKITVLGQAAIDANGDGVIQAAEVRAAKKLEFVYER